MEICTIGFTRHTAAGFFGLLKEERVERLIDVRLNNTGQLAGFAKRDDLRYFLANLCGTEYLHEPGLLAPTQDLLNSYRDKELTWPEYERRFEDLLAARRIESELSPDMFRTRTALLCSEHTADRCHRRLVVEYLGRHWGDLAAVHLPRPAEAAASATAAPAPAMWQKPRAKNRVVSPPSALRSAQAQPSPPHRAFRATHTRTSRR